MTVTGHPPHQEREAMTSRQPDTMPPGTTGHAAIPGDGRTADARHRPVPAPRRPGLVLPLALLILVGLAGLRSEITRPRWDGPLHGDALAVALALEVVLGIMLVITIRRLVTRAHGGTVNAAPASATAVKLLRVLVVVLSTGTIAVAVTTLIGLHQHLFSGPATAQPGQAASAAPSSPATGPGRHSSFTLH